MTFWVADDVFIDASLANHVTSFSPTANIPVFLWYTAGSGSAMSVTSGGVSATDETLTGTAEVTSMGSSELRNDGGVVSRTMMLCVHVAVRSASSVTVHLMIPQSSTAMGLCECDSAGAGSSLSNGFMLLSVMTISVNWPRASMYMGIREDVHVGGVLSSTVT